MFQFGSLGLGGWGFFGLGRGWGLDQTSPASLLTELCSILRWGPQGHELGSLLAKLNGVAKHTRRGPTSSGCSAHGTGLGRVRNENETPP